MWELASSIALSKSGRNVGTEGRNILCQEFSAINTPKNVKKADLRYGQALKVERLWASDT